MSGRNKNLISNFVFLAVGLVVEAIFGIGFFWYGLLFWPEEKSRVWVGFLMGILIAGIYGQSIGLVSLSLIVGLLLLRFLVGRSTINGLVVVLGVVILDMIWRRVCGLEINWLASTVLMVVGWTVNMKMSMGDDQVLKLK